MTASIGIKTMAEYEDRYPDAYGRHEETDPPQTHRHFLGLGLPRQVRGSEPAVLDAGDDAPTVVNIEQPAPAPPPRHVERLRQPLVARTPREIADEVAEQLNASPFIDAAGVVITVDGGEVTLAGTINSLMAIALARALTSNVPGVSRVQVQLRVQRAPRVYETAGAPVYKIAE